MLGSLKLPFAVGSNGSGAECICKDCWAIRNGRRWSEWPWRWEKMCGICSIFWGRAGGRRSQGWWIHQGLVAKNLGEGDGVMLIDESGNVKQGQSSVGVAAQYCGSVGKVANGQVGVHLGYVGRQGYTLLDSQLFMPAEWFEESHTHRRQACGLPSELSYRTKPEIGLELLQA